MEQFNLSIVICIHNQSLIYISIVFLICIPWKRPNSITNLQSYGIEYVNVSIITVV